MPKGALSGRAHFGGIRCWLLLAIFLRGFQLLLVRIVLIKSQIVSEIVPHSEGHGAPPKESRNIIRPSRRAGIWVQVWMAVDAFRWHCQNAAFMSSFVARILFFGYRFLAVTAQFMIRLMAVPKEHGISLSEFTWLFTDVPDCQTQL
jgi:hypothetical protein